MPSAAEVQLIMTAKDQMSDVLKNVQRNVEGLGSASQGISGSLGGLSGALGGLVAAALPAMSIGAIFMGIKDAIGAAAAEEVGIQRLAASVRASGASWVEAQTKIEAYIGSQTRRTALDDGEARDAISKLTQITGDYNQALALLPIAQDMAAGTGMGLAQASQLLGRVQEGQVSVLRRYGIVLEEGTSATEAMAAVQARFAGQAEAYGATTQGQMESLGIVIGNLKETIGGGLLPVITPLIASLADLAVAVMPSVVMATNSTIEAFTKVQAIFVNTGIALDNLSIKMTATGTAFQSSPIIQFFTDLDTKFRALLGPLEGIYNKFIEFNNLALSFGGGIGGIGAALAKTGADALLADKGVQEFVKTITTMPPTLSSAAASVAEMDGRLTSNMANMVGKTSAASAAISATLIKAFQSGPVATALGQLSGITAAHNAKMMGMEQQSAAKIQEMHWQSGAKSVQAAAHFQAEYQGLLAAGRDTDAAKLQQKYNNEAATTEGALSYEEQIQQRSLITQQIQQVQAYQAMLVQQRDKVLESLALQVQEAEAKGKITHEAAVSTLQTISQAGSAQLQMEFETKTAMVQVAEEWAKGTVDAHLMVLKAMAAIEQAQFGAQGQLDALQGKLSSFHIKMPKVPPLDFTKIAEPKAIKDHAERAGEVVSRAAAEPITKTMVEVVAEIDKGVKAAQSAILSLVDFDLPTGWQAGLDKFAEWTTEAVESLYDQMLPLKDKAKELAPVMEDIGKVGQTITAMSTALSGAAMLEAAPEWTAWAKQLSDMLIATMAMISQVVGALKPEELKAFADNAETLGKVLSLAGVSLEGVKAPPANFVAIFDQYLVALEYAASELVASLSAATPEFIKSAELAAKVAPLIKATMDVLSVNLAALAPPQEDFFLIFADWLETVLEATRIITTRMSAVDKPWLELLEKAGTVSGLVKRVMEVLGVSLSGITAPRWDFIASFTAWMEGLFEATRILVLRMSRADDNWKALMDQAAELSPRIKAVTDILGIGLSSIAAPPANFIDTFTAWMDGLFEVTRILTLRMSGADQLWKDAMAKAGEVGALAKGVLDILSISIINVVKPPEDFAATFAVWMEAIFEANRQLVTRLNQVGPEWRAAMAKAADVVGVLKEVMSILSIDISKIKAPTSTTLQADIDAWMLGLLTVARSVSRWLSNISETWRARIADAATVAPSIKAVLDLLGIDLTKFKTPESKTLAADIETFMIALLIAATKVSRWLAKTSETWRAMVADAAKLAPDIRAVMELIGIDLTKIKAVDPELFDAQFSDWISQLLGTAESIADSIDDYDEAWLGTWERAKNIAPSINAVLTLLSFDPAKIKAVDPAVFDAQFSDWIDQLIGTAESLADSLDDYDAIWLATFDKAALIAPKIKSILDLLGADLTGVFVPPNFSAQVDKFAAALKVTIDKLVTWIDGLPSDWKSTIIPAAAKTAEELKSVMDLLNLGKIMSDFMKAGVIDETALKTATQRLVDNAKAALAIIIPELLSIQRTYGAGLTVAQNTAKAVMDVVGVFPQIANAINEAVDAGGIDYMSVAWLMRDLSRAAALIDSSGNLPGLGTAMPDELGGGQLPLPGGKATSPSKETSGRLGLTINLFLPDGTLFASHMTQADINAVADVIDIRLGEMLSEGGV